MKYKQKRFHVIVFAASICIIALHISCSQYNYSSPLPGVVDIRLRTISDSTRIPFTSLNNFVIKIASVLATRDDQAKGPIYADLEAISRTTEENLNTLSPQAKD